MPFLDDYKKSQILFNKRAILAFILVCSVFIIIIGRLIYLQILQHERYQTLSKNNQVTILPIAPVRGNIYDRNGIILAENLPSYQVEIIPEKSSNLETTFNNLKQLIEINTQEEENFFSTVKNHQKFKSIPLRFNLNEIEIAKIAVNQHLFPEIEIKANFIRNYPIAEPLAHALGYVGRISDNDLEKINNNNYRGTHFIGKTGIERYYENILHGKVGYKEVETNAKGRIIRTIFEESPIKGDDIYLSIDSELQTLAYDLLGSKQGAIVAIDPRNGEVLALISKPSFNPNLFTLGISKTNFEFLNFSKQQPLLNRAVRGTYPPASLIKPMVALQGLQKQVVDTEYKIFDPGYFKFPNHSHKYRDWNPYGHGWINLEAAIYQSCDTFFYKLANVLGIDAIEDILKNFGFGAKTEIDLFEETSGILPSRTWKQTFKKQPWFPGETLITAIGQGYFTATPVQLAYATTILATKGKTPKPHIFLKKQNYMNQDVYYKKIIHPYYNALQNINPKYWTIVTDAMQKTLKHNRGTAHRKITTPLKYPIAGKTGTAQLFTVKQNEKYNHDTTSEHLRDHNLFNAFAPVDNPKIAVAIIIENGARSVPNSADIANKLITYYLDKTSKVS